MCDQLAIDKNTAEMQSKALAEENLQLKHTLSNTESNLQLAEARLKRQESAIAEFKAHGQTVI